MLDIQDPNEARKIIRDNKYTEQTAGTANKYVQGNLCILPSKYAMDFASFCQKNPKPCPLIGFGTKGDPSLKDLGDIDIRTDVPQYRIWEKGKLIDVDTGFIVFNDKNYPDLIKFFDHLDVQTANSEMSFAVSDVEYNIEYGGKNLKSLFAQYKNIFNINYLKMIYEIYRFYKLCKITKLDIITNNYISNNLRIT